MDKMISNKKIWHIIMGGTIGNLTEWYNFLLYGYLASVISQLFFPSHNKLLSLSLVFSVFALSFLVRPLGGMLFGWIGDTYGRQRALVISLIMIAVPTFLIGCLPTYQSIGIASPILLCVFRIFQGLSAGGEHTGSAIYIAEYAPAGRRGLWVSTVPTSAAIGMLISSAAALLIINSFTNEQLLTWGWRVGYWVGTVLCLLSIFLRIRLPETPDFQKMQAENLNKHYSVSALLKEPQTLKNVFIVFSLTSSWGIFYQILFIWMPTYLAHIQNFSQSTALQINNIFVLIFACLMLCMGYLADYIRHKSLLIFSCITIFISAYPLFKMLSSGSLQQVYIAMAVFTVIFSIYLPVAFVTMIELFAVRVRYTALSLGFNMGLAIFGGTCPLIATGLITITKNNTAPAFYVMLAAFTALLTCKALSSKMALQQ